MSTRLVAVTHGDPSKKEECGRPLFQRKAENGDPPGVEKVYVCPIHGPLFLQKEPFAFITEDERLRRKFIEW